MLDEAADVRLTKMTKMHRKTIFNIVSNTNVN